MTSTKQTAKNNKTMRAVKALMNGKIYAKFAEKMNAEGHAAAMAYLQQFFTVSIADRF